MPFAVAAFAIGAPFIRYSAEIKSYGIDMAAAIAFSLIALKLRDPDATAARCVFAGSAGAILVWFSQPTVFVLAGLGAALLLAWLRDRDPADTRAPGDTRDRPASGRSPPPRPRSSSIRHVTPATRAYMDQFWRYRNGFFPRPFRKPGDALWLWDRVLELFNDPTVLRYRWPALYGGLVIVGLVALWRRNRFGALVLLGPFAVGVLAAVAQQFPVQDPRGAVRASHPHPRRGAGGGVDPACRRRASTPRRAELCMAALFVVPALAFVQRPPPYWVEDHKTVFAFFREHRQPGDAVFVFPYEVQAVERYGSEYGLAPGDYQVGTCSRDDRRVFLRDVDRYRGRARVWLLDGSVPALTAARKSVEGYLSTIGVRKESIAIPSEKPLDPVGRLALRLERPGAARGGVGGDVSPGAAGPPSAALRRPHAAAAVGRSRTRAEEGALIRGRVTLGCPPRD